MKAGTRGDRGVRPGDGRPDPLLQHQDDQAAAADTQDLDAAAILLRKMWLAVSGTAADPEGDIRATLDTMDVDPIHAAAETVKLLAQEPTTAPSRRSPPATTPSPASFPACSRPSSSPPARPASRCWTRSRSSPPSRAAPPIQGGRCRRSSGRPA
ncbi:hypothetical protein NKH18_13385 [Streptomyces sp. M10(2022)]